MTFPKARLDTREKVISLKVAYDVTWKATTFSVTFETIKTLAIGRLLTGSLESSPSHLRAGTRTDIWRRW